MGIGVAVFMVTWILAVRLAAEMAQPARVPSDTVASWRRLVVGTPGGWISGETRPNKHRWTVVSRRE